MDNKWKMGKNAKIAMVVTLISVLLMGAVVIKTLLF